MYAYVSFIHLYFVSLCVETTLKLHTENYLHKKEERINRIIRTTSQLVISYSGIFGLK